ncbi:DUF397 domain-containing protein [Streptomyces sp. NBC_01239]|nr:DUF397 domain-containing protein [Streptomyces sp. NBC_01239]
MSKVTWRRSSYSNQDGGQCLEAADNAPTPVLPVRRDELR